MEQEKLRITIRQVIREGFSEMFEHGLKAAIAKQEKLKQGQSEEAMDENAKLQGADKVFARLNKKLR